MKKWFGILLFVFSFSYGQNDTINRPVGVVAADRMNVVYRGILNPIAISVPDCKSFTAECPGLVKVSEGHYTLAPASGLEAVIILTIVEKDGSEVIEKHPFKIKNTGRAKSLINGKDGLVTMSEEEFKTAEITIDSEIFQFDVVQFSFKIVGQSTRVVNGNSLKNVKNIDFPPGSEIVISEIKVKSVGYEFQGCILISPIVIQTYDRERFKSDKKYKKAFNNTLFTEQKYERKSERKIKRNHEKYIKDSLQTMHTQEKLKLKKQ